MTEEETDIYLSPADSHVAVHEHLMRIESAFYYSPGDAMAAVHPLQGTVSPRRGKDLPPMCIVSGNGNRPLAEAVAMLLGTPTHQTLVRQRANGEVNVRIDESVLGADVYIIQSTTGNEVIDVNTAVMELLLLIRKMRLSNARRVTAVIPYFAYSRQDSKKGVRNTLSASAVAEMLTQAGVDRVTTLDLHSGQIQGFFGNTPLDNLQTNQEFAKYLRNQSWFDPNNMAIVSIGSGGVERARKLADRLNIGCIVTILKRCNASGGKTLQPVGDVKGRVCVILLGMCDTGQKIEKACELLHALGATKITACCTHGILTPPCPQRLNDCDALSEIVVSDSIPQEEHLRLIPKLKVLTIAPLLATAINMHTRDECISALFDTPPHPVENQLPPPPPPQVLSSQSVH
ncbi:putative phosphoribosylpyrophosphate synthetase [Trypanosoma cruzi]|uniref:ribose-phosphate diphosphokinase n=3 Tax=Trypanosoma cruzi TaxID=5693 RepID=A0A2V2X2T7_TRYCR|nr:phosphoribosylpyrophosphate synthetase [Trypanosoma cruzi]KAF8290434.1 putative phosphoribosylpyrophosphate synthetase [Trypanosoma cruzi]KAF8299375.1 putative phosphoribosylpyrophosphate synthetase [Trypanosoma cruzi]PWV15107.1 putative phosphoribosylpyrophosphate synthetase [Trypanosoma cruzi]